MYENLRELPVHNFNELIISNNTKWLLRDGEEQTPETLEDKRIDIIDEYIKESPNQSQMFDISLRTKLLIMNSQRVVLTVLSQTENVSYKDILKKWNVKDVHKTLKSLEIKIRRLEARLLDTDNESGKKNTFEETLVFLKKSGYQIDRYKTPVIEYLYALKQAEKDGRRS